MTLTLVRSEDIDDASTEVILKRVRILCPEMVDEQADGLAATNGFDVRQVYVARRPMRHGGLHFVLKPGNPLPLISCYGAGANGYKISWGLAGKVDEFFSGRPISENDSPTVAKNQALGESEENQAILPGRIGNPVIYEPSVGKALTQGSTSLIVRLKPGVIVKCPRYSWWHSDTADATSFVKDIKHSFEVEERLFDILGTHPSIVRYVSRIRRDLMYGVHINIIFIAAISVPPRNRVDYSLTKLAMVTYKITLTSIMTILI